MSWAARQVSGDAQRPVQRTQQPGQGQLGLIRGRGGQSRGRLYAEAAQGQPDYRGPRGQPAQPVVHLFVGVGPGPLLGRSAGPGLQAPIRTVWSTASSHASARSIRRI